MDYGNTSRFRPGALTDYKGENCSWPVNACLSAEEGMREGVRGFFSGSGVSKFHRHHQPTLPAKGPASLLEDGVTKENLYC